MKKSIWYSMVLSLVFGLSSSIFAHAGHGNEGESLIIHYLTEPIHIGVGVLAVGLIVLTIYKFKQGKAKVVKEK